MIQMGSNDDLFHKENFKKLLNFISSIFFVVDAQNLSTLAETQKRSITTVQDRQFNLDNSGELSSNFCALVQHLHRRC